MHERADAGWRLTGLAVAWLAGIGWQLQQRSLWPATAIYAAAAIAVLALAVGWHWRRSRALAPLNWAGCLGVALLAFASCGWRADHRLAYALPPALEGQDLRVTGVVATLPQRSPTGLRFRFEVEAASLRGEPVQVPEQLALGWYKGQHDDAASNQPRAELRAGQRWRFTLRLRRPHGNLNPHGFDYELSLFEQGLRATGYVRDAPAPELLHRAAGHPVERLRQRVRDAIEASVPDRRAAGVLAALAVGDQGAIAREDWDLYRAAGIAHLISISGLHITMFAWLSGLAISILWRRNRRAALWLPTPWAARWGGLSCAAAYAVFSGWGVPSQRTVWMLATVTLLQTLGVRWPWPLVLLVAAVVVTAIDPWALMQAGFWLSFMAVGLLMASSSQADTTDRTHAVDGTRTTADASASGWHGRLRGLGIAARRTIGNDLRTQAIATIGLTPLTLVFFHQVSLIGFAANLIAIPLITLVVTPLALLGTLIVPLWALGAFAVQGLNAALGALAGLPGAVWMAPVAPLWAQLAGLLGAVLLVLPLPWRAKVLALPLLVALLWPPRALPPPGGFDLWALDVGQGSALLVRTRHHLLVFDAGPQYSPGNDAGERVLLPLLHALGESHVDRLVLSHRDLDHVGGAAALLKAMPVDEVLSSLEADHPLLQAAKAVRCNAGQSWSWDGVQFDMLHPASSDYERKLKSNAMSCVLRVAGLDAGGQRRSVLLTGDIEREQEAALIAATPEALQSDVLIAPHHGSRTSSSLAFLEAVAPRVAVFQAGYRNRFGHPAPDVTARYRAQGIALQSSPGCGAWHWPADGPTDGICERDSARRYWHDNAPQPAGQPGEQRLGE